MTAKPSEARGISRLQVKVCGLTKVDEAIACAKQGADAIGLVFYPPSPRFVSDALAREISTSLPEEVSTVGVFVNEPYSIIMRKVEICRLKAVQLHGAESPELVDSLGAAGILVIKSLFFNGRPPFSEASSYRAGAYLVEGGGGRLPGGNAMSWDWGAVKGCFGGMPCIIAGGLNPGNVALALKEVTPDAVDVSSGVESVPGRKDISKVKAFLEAVREIRPDRTPRRIF